MVKESIQRFIEAVKEEPVRTEQLGLNESMQEILEVFESVYLRG